MARSAASSVAGGPAAAKPVQTGWSRPASSPCWSSARQSPTAATAGRPGCSLYWAYRQRDLAAHGRDLGGQPLQLVADVRQVRDDAHALLQVERAEPLEVAPDRDPLAGRLGWDPID